MSMLKKYSPRKIRGTVPKSNSQDNESNNFTEPKKIDEKELIEKYSYRKEEEIPMARIKSEPLAQKETFNLFDLSFFCEQHLILTLRGPIEIHQEKVYKSQQKFLEEKMNIYSRDVEILTIENFESKIWKYRGKYFIPEEYFLASGFLREQFNITEVYVLFDTGEILLKETEYCKFWHKERVRKFFEMKVDNLINPEILDEDICYECNFTCSYRHRKQMDS